MRLQPENKTMEPIRTRDVRIVGPRGGSVQEGGVAMAVLLDRARQRTSLWSEEGGGATLDDLLSGAWEGLAAALPAACPVCHGELAPRWSAGAGVVGGRCGDCGSELS